MRSRLSEYRLRLPSTLDDALAILADEPGRWRPFAGGTDLMVLLEAGKLAHREYVDLWHLSDLRGVDVREEEIILGALTTYSDVRRHALLQREFPLLCAAAAETGGIATQNRGTIGGNIANASPAADTPPVLLAYDASLELRSRRGVRRVDYAAFHTGYKRMELAPDELIAAIHLPRRQEATRQVFRKVGTRRAQAISKVCFAGRLTLTADRVTDVRLAFGSLAPTVVRATHVEESLRGTGLGSEAVETALAGLRQDLAPIDDDRSTAAYRLRVAENLVRTFLID